MLMIYLNVLTNRWYDDIVEKQSRYNNGTVNLALNINIALFNVNVNFMFEFKKDVLRSQSKN